MIGYFYCCRSEKESWGSDNSSCSSIFENPPDHGAHS